VVDQFPIELIMFLAGALTAGPTCFFIGRKDAPRAFRSSEPSIDRTRDDFPAVLTGAANGEGIFFSIINCLSGRALGLMATLATLLLVAIPIQIAFEGG
jgi:hypothetical protein